MRQKRIMLLGGLRYLLPVIKAAHKQGYYVITCDYLPDNIAHKFADKYVNASIIDKEAVLKVAMENNIDGIMSFAVDPGVVTAAYVAEQLGLPGNPYSSVQILQDKSLFRQFLADNSFNVPKACGFTSVQSAMEGIDGFEFPIIVKPVDSAGSKGVTRVDKHKNLKKAVEYAFSMSLLKKKIIIEEFIDRDGFSSDSDSFSIDGKLVYVSFSDQRFDNEAANPYTPSAYSYPTVMPTNYQKEMISELQRLLSLLKMRTSIYNIETRLSKNGKSYIMEVSPRGGGNRLAEMLKYATDVDLIENAVKAAVGERINDISMPKYNGYWAEIILHANKCGIFNGLELNKNFPGDIIEKDIWVKQGDKVAAFEGANNAIGTLILKFRNHEEMEQSISDPAKWLNISII